MNSFSPNVFPACFVTAKDLLPQNSKSWNRQSQALDSSITGVLDFCTPS